MFNKVLVLCTGNIYSPYFEAIQQRVFRKGVTSRMSYGRRPS